jgi:hypothetical protein
MFFVPAIKIMFSLSHFHALLVDSVPDIAFGYLYSIMTE